MKDWEVFEHEVRLLVEAFGYEAETTQPSHDYGVDVIAQNRHRKIVIQCKLYGKGRIGGNTIMQLVGCREYFEAAEAICITTSHFTKQAHEIAKKRSIHLVDRDKLLALCKERSLTIPSLTVLEMDTETVLDVQKRVTCGRADDNNVIIRDHRVSRHHTVIERVGLHLTLTDCVSLNGTYLNGARITTPMKLNYSDTVTIGPCSFRVVFRLPEA